MFLAFLQVFKDNDTLNDTENNYSDSDDNDIRNSTIFRMCSFRLPKPTYVS